MESTPKTDLTGYEFLTKESVKQYYAELTSRMLEGYHVSSIRDAEWHKVIEADFKDWKFFFLELYTMILHEDFWEGESFYFLELDYSSSDRRIPREQIETLEPLQVVMAFMMLHHFYRRIVDTRKVISWDIMREEIINGEFKDSYQTFFFQERNITPKQIAMAKTRFKTTCRKFIKLGWLTKYKTMDQVETQYIISASIHRILRIYQEEFESFSTNPQSFTKSELLKR